MTSSLRQRWTIHVSVTAIWLLLYLWNAVVYIFPSLFNRVVYVETWFLAAFLTVIAFTTELRNGRISYRFFQLLLTVAVLIGFFVLRRYGAGLYMLPIFSLLFLYEFRQITWGRREEKAICLLCAAIYVAMLYQTWRVHTGSWQRASSYNKNTIAEMLFVCTAVIFLYFYHNRNLRVRLLLGLSIVLTVVCLLVLQCRTALACLILFVLLNLFRTAQKRPNVLLVIAVTLMILGTLFPILYISLFDRWGTGFLSMLGKDTFTGREYIWRVNLKALTSTPITLLFGTPRLSSYAGDNNLHNLYMLILIRGGLIGMATYWSIFLSFLRKGISSLALVADDDNSFCYAYMALCMLLYGFSEAGFLWSSFMPFGLLPFMVLAARTIRPEGKVLDHA